MENNFEFKGFDDVNDNNEPENISEGEKLPEQPAVSLPGDEEFNILPEEPAPPVEPEQKPEYSYSPPPSRSFYPSGDYGAGAGHRYGQPVQRPQQAFQPPQPLMAEPRKKRDRKLVSGASLVACTLAAAIIGGTAGVGGYIYYNENYAAKNTSSVSSSVTQLNNINVTETEAGLVEAIAETVSPSVVGIRTTVSITSFFGRTQSQEGEGSGIIYKSDGYIITNYHVVESTYSSQAKIEVFLPQNPEEAIAAEIVGYDISSDLAVLKIDRTGLPAVKIGDSGSLKVGETAVAIGNPGGLDFMGSVSSGIISGLNRTIQLENTGNMPLIQTDAAINPGNSGGALVNAKGELIGVNSSKIVAGGYEGMGFAIPSNAAVEICQNIINNKDQKKAYLGLQIDTEYDSKTLQNAGYPAGVVIGGVIANGPCEGSGIQRYDVLTKIGDKVVTSYSEYNTARLSCKPGEKVALTIYRVGGGSGKYYTVTITMGETIS